MSNDIGYIPAHNGHSHDSKGNKITPPEKTDVAAQEARAVTRLSWAILVVSVLSTTFMYALDNTVLANIRPAIISDIGHIETLPWITVAYALGEAGSNPIWGKLYRLLDNKLLYCASVIILDVGSAVCGSAPSPDALIVGRVVAGVGGSGIYIGTLNILSALTLVNERALYLSFVGLAWCLGTILGPIIGGAFADDPAATWRWAFYVNLCISVAGAPAYLWLLPLNPSHLDRTGHKFWTELDVTGALLYFGASLTLIMAISFGGVIYAWNSGRLIALLVLSGVLWILFGFQQSRPAFTTQEQRLFPVSLIRNKEMCILFAETAIGITCIVIPIYFIPLYFQFVHGDTTLYAGVRTLPFICSAVVGCLVNGALFERFSFYIAWFAIGEEHLECLKHVLLRQHCNVPS